ncbi:unnamed protein product [Diabrotica balteata]|uniref:Uncharacterized protein n=1 Tax=Diabrotica balteata TaxID=107213 RepID=A0A9N9X7U1_DIABA|nr:unnamed protein product [Diabrotica balteata]
MQTLFLSQPKTTSAEGITPYQLPMFQPVIEKPKLKYKKYEDLMELLQFVLPTYHEFYLSPPPETKTGKPLATDAFVGNENDDNHFVNNIYDTDDSN